MAQIPNNNDQDIKFSDLTDKEAEELIRQQGRRAGYLLNKVNWPDELKQSFLTLLPEMGPKEIDDFTRLLESAYEDQETAHIDKEYEQKLKDIVLKYQARQNSIKQNTMSQLEALEKKIEALKNN